MKLYSFPSIALKREAVKLAENEEGTGIDAACRLGAPQLDRVLNKVWGADAAQLKYEPDVA